MLKVVEYGNICKVSRQIRNLDFEDRIYVILWYYFGSAEKKKRYIQRQKHPSPNYNR